MSSGQVHPIPSMFHAPCLLPSRPARSPGVTLLDNTASPSSPPSGDTEPWGQTEGSRGAVTGRCDIKTLHGDTRCRVTRYGDN